MNSEQWQRLKAIVAEALEEETEAARTGVLENVDTAISAERVNAVPFTRIIRCLRLVVRVASGAKVPNASTRADTGCIV